MHPHTSGSGGGPPASHPCSSPGPLVLVLAVPLLLEVLFPLVVLLPLLGLFPLLVIGIPLLLRPLTLVLLRAEMLPSGRRALRGGHPPHHFPAEVGSHEPVGRERELHQVPGVIRCGVLSLHCPGEVAVASHHVLGVVLPGIYHLLQQIHACQPSGHSVCVKVCR